jgi:UTP--glucose-1-phosphate uridylyltransferase
VPPPVVIPAAGLGRRFLPFSRVVPKELLPIGGKPLIHHALDEAERAGFDQAVIVLSPGKVLIKTYFESGDALAVAQRLHLRFVEQPEPNGVGNAVLIAASQLNTEQCAVLLPDDVVTTSGHWGGLLSLHRLTGAACVCVRPVPLSDSARFGMAGCKRVGDGLRITELVEKPEPTASPSNLAIFGRYVVTKPVLKSLQKLCANSQAPEVSLTEGFAQVLDRDPGVFAIPFNDEIFDAGTPGAYSNALFRYEQSFADAGKFELGV